MNTIQRGESKASESNASTDGLIALLKKTDRPPLRHALYCYGQDWTLSLLLALILLVIFAGPTLNLAQMTMLDSLLCAGLIMISLVLNYCSYYIGTLSKQIGTSFIWILHLALVILASIYIVSAPYIRPSNGGAYFHTGLLGVAMLLLGIPLCRLLAWVIFRPDTIEQKVIRRAARLHCFRGGVQKLGSNRLPLFIIVVFRYTLLILLPAAIFSLLIPYTQFTTKIVGVPISPLFVAFAILTLVTLLYLVHNIRRSIGEEYETSLKLIFFQGPTTILSIIVIIIMILRFCNVHYINYMFVASATVFSHLSVHLIFSVYVLVAYVFLWFYIHWTADFQMNGVLVSLFGSVKEANNLGIEKYSAGQYEIKASGRSCIIRPLELIDALRRAEDTTSLERLNLWVRTYSYLQGAIPYVVIIGFILWNWLHVPLSEISAKISSQDKEMLLPIVQGRQNSPECSPLEENAPRIIIAASGGGSKAAIYVQSVLRGLYDAGYGCNIVLASGISGGSVALAYYATHHRELSQQDGDSPKAWDRFKTLMATPFILDILNRLSEFRTVFGESVGGERRSVPNGILLADEIESRLGADGANLPLGALPIGLILNTSIAGASPDWRWQESPPAGIDVMSDEIKCSPWDRIKRIFMPTEDDKCYAHSGNSAAGGRLVFSNVSEQLLQSPKLDANGPAPMPLWVVRDPEVKVLRAAAMSANFPPVFSNAAVDLYGQAPREARRFWITDGGAVENRGTPTLFWTVRALTERLITEKNGGVLPDLHIIVADVSAPGGLYEQDRGIGSALGAGSQLGRALEQQLYSDIEKSYRDPNEYNQAKSSRIHFHELDMPNLLRDGAIETHWMLPETIKIRCPVRLGDNCSDKLVSRDQIVDLVERLHRPAAPFTLEETEEKTVLDWINDDPQNSYAKKWGCLIKALDGAKQNLAHDEFTRRCGS